MFPHNNSNPPPYNNSIPPSQAEFVFVDDPPPSPSLSDLEIQTFGHRLAYIPTSRPPTRNTHITTPSESQIYLPGSEPLPAYTQTQPVSTPRRTAASLPAPRPQAASIESHVVESHAVVPSQRVVPAQEHPRNPAQPPTSTPSLTTRVASRGQTHTTKASTSHNDVSDDELEPAKFELVVWAIKPVKTTTAGRKKTAKVAKVEPSSFGPGESNTDLDWASFLEIVADLLETKPVMLVLHSLEWKWLKPANSPWLPLRTQSAYHSLVRQLRAPPKNVSGAYIIVKMDWPL
ncbi:hypothetical protein BDZ97DRAFT_1761251 [Flammula alnicola]|nr:hypothetical protein BDZ97DRAFT_1761251 [Flammula alnicola]